MQPRDRIKELRRVKASELIPNEKNWRVHPTRQRVALSGILESIGYADALLARETPEGLKLIDGHLRAETTPDAEVPVLVLDVTEQEAEMLLSTVDPIAAMADADQARLDELLQNLDSDNFKVNNLLDGLRDGMTTYADYLTDGTLSSTASGGEDFNPMDEWVGMPEFSQEDKTSLHKLVVHFFSEEDIEEFAALVGQPVTIQTRYIHHPPEDRDIIKVTGRLRYSTNDEA